MKSKDFGAFLTNYGQMLAESGARNNSDAWQSLVVIFDIKPSATVKDVCKKFAGDNQSNDSGPGIDVIISSLSALTRFLGPVAKKSLIDDLDALRAALERMDKSSLADLVATTSERLQTQAAGPARSRTSGAINSQLVERHLQLLEAAFGDEAAFRNAYQQLTSDLAVKLPEAKQIAKAFTKGSATSKEKAFKLIWGRHASLMESRAKAAATAGRSAA